MKQFDSIFPIWEELLKKLGTFVPSFVQTLDFLSLITYRQVLRGAIATCYDRIGRRPWEPSRTTGPRVDAYLDAVFGAGGGLRTPRVFGPGVFGVASAHVGAHAGVGAGPETLQIIGNRKRATGRRE